MNPPTFDDAVEAGRMALGSMAKGDAGPSTALWSQRDDVVLANPLGPPIVGFPLVADETARVASMFVGGEQPEFDEVVRWASDNLGYVVALEHAQVQRAGSDERRVLGPPSHDNLPSRGRRVACLRPPR